MAFEIVWTPTAAFKLAEVLEFLSANWSHKVSADFTISLEMQIRLLQQFPEIGIKSDQEPSIRKILITKHNALYYATKGNHLIILTIVDTRSSSYFQKEK